jgi:hypothetical protein
MKSIALFCLLTLTWCTAAAGVDVQQSTAGAAEILIAAAGSTPGANGTFFRSEITISNLRDQAQRIELRWLPQAGAPPADPVFVNLSSGDSRRSEDFVQDVLHTTGLGSIIAAGVLEDGSPDPSARLHATSRIWTPQPGTSGTTSQSLPTIPLAPLGGDSAAIFGLRKTDQYRVNVGLVNFDAQHEQTFDVEIPSTRLSIPPESYEVRVLPLSMQQISLNTPWQPLLYQVEVSNTTPPATRSNRWATYGSSIDNVTGDAWSEIGVEK